MPMRNLPMRKASSISCFYSVAVAVQGWQLAPLLKSRDKHRDVLRAFILAKHAPNSHLAFLPLQRSCLRNITDTMARIHKGGLSTNLGFRYSYDAFLHVFLQTWFVKTRQNASNDAQKPRFVNKPPLWIRAIAVRFQFGIFWRVWMQRCKWPYSWSLRGRGNCKNKIRKRRWWWRRRSRRKIME